MLENIREGVKKPWVKVVVFVIVISFVFAGYFSSSFFLGDPNAVAVVNGESISQSEFQRAYNNFKARRADFYNANVKTEEDERNFQENVLQQLITMKVTEQSTNELGLRLSTNALRKVIQTDPNYQLDGKYSSGLVDQTLARAQISREAFKSIYANQETSQQLIGGITGTEFTLKSEAQSDYELMSQKRSGKVLKLDFEKFKAGLEIGEDDLNQYYQDNQEAFRIEEKVSVEYVELSVDSLQNAQDPTEEEVETYYQDNLSRFRSEEQRQYSHILILSEDGEDEALAKATAISERIAKGEDFAEIAKSESDDAPTAEVGGDLGILLPGSLEESAEEAVAKLVNAGDVTQPIKIEDGYQILKLTNLIEGNVQPLEQVKAELVPELKKQKAEEIFHAKAELLKEKSFEFADSLSEAATATELEVKTSNLFGQSSREGIFANQTVKDAAFSTDVKDGLLNSQPIELGENHIVVLRLKEHKPSEIQPLEEVKDRVRNNLIQSRAKQAAGDLANTLLTKLKAQESIDELLTENTLSWTDLDKIERNNASLSYTTNQQFFKMPTPAEGEVSLEMAEDYQGFAVLMLSQVEKGDWSKADDANKKQRELYISSYFANAGYSAFIENNRKNADVKRNLGVLSR
ncbi:SurA N-terminal domain-containing protein [Aliikangiella coralliicola]|uniref:Periplasmic chaperone PpiD n=1 Tax=Aliikangiella coralliicola TaxID=2592383 RepID=A0A545UAY0_9GAMM|nr:SurA N-terminal domain-containing protein [Aliikangiella coralliicola]TQV86617.1 hypothetical protein FLL46_17105 [Aliikangiella coralliicola]